MVKPLPQKQNEYYLYISLPNQAINTYKHPNTAVTISGNLYLLM